MDDVSVQSTKIFKTQKTLKKIFTFTSLQNTSAANMLYTYSFILYLSLNFPLKGYIIK
jgi:hypothetical protein